MPALLSGDMQGQARPGAPCVEALTECQTGSIVKILTMIIESAITRAAVYAASAGT